jgi:hypothetical protein
MVFADLRSEHAFFYLRVFRAESFYKVSEMDLWRFAYELLYARGFECWQFGANPVVRWRL